MIWISVMTLHQGFLTDKQKWYPQV